MRFLTIFTLLFVGSAHALQPSMWTENQAKTICALDLRRLYGDTLEVVSVMGKQPHEDNTTLVGLVASDNRAEYKGQQVAVGCIYKQDGSLVMIFFNSKIANWTAPKQGSSQPVVAPSVASTASKEALIRDAIKMSEDLPKYEEVLIRASTRLISQGRCKIADFEEMGGWYRSTTYTRDPVYFTYCGGFHQRNKIHLDASTGEIFKSK